MAKGIREKISVLVPKRLNWQVSLFFWAVIWLCSLPPYGLPILSALAFVFPLCAIGKAGKKEILFWTPLWAALFELATVWWIIPTIHRFGGIPLPVSIALVLLLCVYLGLYTSLFFVSVKLFTDRYGYQGICFAPFIWVLAEWLKGRIFGGFSWWGPGYSASMFENLLQNAHLLGILGLSFLFLMISASFSLLLTQRRKPATLVFSLLTVILLLISHFHGAFYKKQDLKEFPVFRVGLIQPQISQDKKWDENFREEILDRLTGLSNSMTGHSLRALIWPESSIPVEWGQDEGFDLRVKDVAKNMEVPLLFGTVFEDKKGIHNGAILLDQWANRSGSYSKTHLVPFGEYVPMEKMLSFASPIVESVGSFNAGNDLAPLDVYGVKLGVNICYEAIFPGLVRKQVDKGSDIIVNLSNDAWYEGTPAIYQHFMMDRVRAVENFRYLVRSANGGYAAVINPTGGIEAVAGPGEPSFCWGEPRVIKERSVYGKFGDLWLIAVALFLVFAFFIKRAGRTDNLLM